VKGLALTVAFLTLPASAWAQVLTLNCRYESAYDGMKAGRKTPKSGGFSAIVHMNELPRRGQNRNHYLGLLRLCRRF
jgi:hypothetical protein